MKMVSLLFAALVVSGCGDSGTGSGGGGTGGGGTGGSEPVTVDDAKLGTDAAGYAGAGFSKASTKTFVAAQHMGTPMSNIYVNAVGKDAYAKIVADGPTVDLPVGTMIVKEHLDPAGMPMVLTAMYKAEAGYDPENQDIWWGMLTPDGTPAMSGSVGKLAMCNGCHSAAVDTGRAFGVPATGK